MKLKSWFRTLLFSVSFVLIQVSSNGETENEEGELIERNKLIWVGKLFSSFMNNTVMFLIVQLRMFRKIFLDYDVTSFDNFRLLTDIFDYGYEMQDKFWNIINVITQ